MHGRALQTTDQPKGFTLVELLITVVILGIMAGIGGAYYQRSWEKEQLKAATRAAVEWLEDTRLKAIQQSQTCVITINDSNAQFEPSTVGNGNNCSDLYTLDLRASIPNLNQLKVCSQNSTTTNLSCSSNTSSTAMTDIVITPRGTIAQGGLIKFNAGDTIDNRCIAITQPLGLIRQGIENSGTCNYNTAF